MARDIQLSTMPDNFLESDSFEISASVEPARGIGGDFYDFFMIDDDHLCLVMADVSGKGIPASLFMMTSKTTLKNCVKACDSISETLTVANRSICSDNNSDMFVTVWMGVLELSTGILRAGNAGHEYPTIGRKGQKYEILKDKHDFVIGGMENLKFGEYEIQLNPGDKIFVYTDGVPESADRDFKLYGTDRMIDALNIDPDACTKDVLKNVRQSIADFVKDAEQFDDLTMMCVEYKGNNKTE
jgi:serine phosphatase RsbU (regulator of sigma subunit)